MSAFLYLPLSHLSCDAVARTFFRATTEGYEIFVKVSIMYTKGQGIMLQKK